MVLVRCISTSHGLKHIYNCLKSFHPETTRLDIDSWFVAPSSGLLPGFIKNATVAKHVLHRLYEGKHENVLV